MDVERGAVFGVVGVIVVTTLVSGPLVGVVDLTPEPDRPAIGQGNATVGDVTLPAAAEIREGRFDSGEYVLRVPDASVELASVAGNPAILYQVSVDGLDFTRSTTHFVTSDDVGAYSLSIARVAIDPGEVDADSYEGTVSVSMDVDGEHATIAERSITVEVVR